MSSVGFESFFKNADQDFSYKIGKTTVFTKCTVCAVIIGPRSAGQEQVPLQ
jgi:hypothetical protein